MTPEHTSNEHLSEPGPIRADLGRPETAQEEADRKAENTRLHRARQNLRNLAAALGVTVLVVLVLVLIVPRNDNPRSYDVDYAAAASEAQPGYTEQLATPKVPENWAANRAEIREGADGVTEWYIGYVVNDGDTPIGFVGMSQGINANETWVVDKVERRAKTGEITLGGVTWAEYDHTDLTADEAGNTRYSLVGKIGDSTFVVYGSHSALDVQALATLIAEQHR